MLPVCSDLNQPFIRIGITTKAGVKRPRLFLYSIIFSRGLTKMTEGKDEEPTVHILDQQVSFISSRILSSSWASDPTP